MTVTPPLGAFHLFFQLLLSLIHYLGVLFMNFYFKDYENEEQGCPVLLISDVTTPSPSVQCFKPHYGCSPAALVGSHVPVLCFPGALFGYLLII